MSCKTRSQCFKGYFYEDNVWSPIFEKRIVWSPISAIFSKMTGKNASIGPLSYIFL